MDNPLRMLPSIKNIQDQLEFQDILKTNKINNEYLTVLAKQIVDDYRLALTNDSNPLNVKSKAELLGLILARLKSESNHLLSNGLKRVINATGVVLHTNLGRARLSREMAKTVTDVASGYSNLEFDLEKGKRGSRESHIEPLLRVLTGAEAAMVVNNNAAAVFLILRTFAKQREVIVSRGELVEIGGSFRVSSIMEESDAHLVEVGTTNKTHLRDYEEAINDNTAVLLKVHKSNFKMVGYTSEVGRKDLSALAHEHSLLYYEDLGSGALFPFSEHNISDEPTVKEIINDNVDLVSMSGDKLLGGPQAGIILGKKKYIDQLKKHQLMRVLRTDKMTLAALATSLQAYLNPELLMEKVPTIKDIVTDEASLLHRANQLASSLNQISGLTAKITTTTSYVGGGTMPEVELKSYGVTVGCEKISAASLAKGLRIGEPAVVCRIDNDHLLLDVRTIDDWEVAEVQKAFYQIMTN